MLVRGCFRLLVCTATLATLVVCAAGCASTPEPRGAAPDSQPPAHVTWRSPLTSAARDKTGNNYLEDAQTAFLREGAELRWSIESTSARPAKAMTGRAVVGPDGTIELGPYGTVHVAGLTVRQAKTTVTNHLSAYLANPQVRLALENDGSGNS
jgi:hypothetical protein